MGSFEFEWKGKTYNILTEGGYPFPDSDEAAEALEQWRESPEGIEFFGPLPADWSKEHCLDDRYPFDPDSGCRVDAENPDEEPYIDWCEYEKCRYGCYKHYYMTSAAHECSLCGVFACQGCAAGSFKACSSKDCEAWICGNHKAKKCDGCKGSK